MCRAQISRSVVSTDGVPSRSRNDLTVAVHPAKRSGISPITVASTACTATMRRRSHLIAAPSVTAACSSAGRTRSAAASMLGLSSAASTASSISDSSPGFRDA